MSTARAIISDAYLIDGITNVGSALSPDQANQGLTCLNQILGQWSLMPLTIPVTAREVFPLTAGRGGPSDPYTIGPGGDFDTSRPPEIDNVGLLVTTVTMPFEISRSIYTNDAYASIVQKELTSSYFTGLYYNATYLGGLGTIQLWPVPSADGTSLVLYRPLQLRQFVNLDDDYVFPPGAEPALTYELAKWLAMRFAGQWNAQLEQMAGSFLALYQRGNTAMADLGMDPGLTAQSGVYNIISDTISGFRGR
jgi:hypothetical protein